MSLAFIPQVEKRLKFWDKIFIDLSHEQTLCPLFDPNNVDDLNMFVVQQEEETKKKLMGNYKLFVP